MLSVKFHCLIVLHVVFTGVLAGSASTFEANPHKGWDDLCAFEAKAYQMSEDFGTEPRYDCILQHYYYIPCPTYSWFWAYSGWTPGDMVGACFRMGDQGTGGFDMCDPYICTSIGGFRFLDFAGYGTVYPGLFTVEVDFYVSDGKNVPVCHLWNSGPVESGYGWNYLTIDYPYVDIHECFGYECPYPTIVATMTMVGTEGIYPAMGFDNVSKPAGTGCEMHDYGCTPALYPRKPQGSAGTSVHSGYIGGYPFQHWPPLAFPDGKHATDPSGPVWYGYSELAWRLYVICWGP
jgi:hypothetical protein